MAYGSGRDPRWQQRQQRYPEEVYDLTRRPRYPVRRIDVAGAAPETLQRTADSVRKFLSVRAKEVGRAAWSWWPPVDAAVEGREPAGVFYVIGGEGSYGVAMTWPDDLAPNRVGMYLYAGTAQEPDKEAGAALLEQLEADLRESALSQKYEVVVMTPDLMGLPFYEEHGYAGVQAFAVKQLPGGAAQA